MRLLSVIYTNFITLKSCYATRPETTERDRDEKIKSGTSFNNNNTLKDEYYGALNPLH